MTQLSAPTSGSSTLHNKNPQIQYVPTLLADKGAVGGDVQRVHTAQLFGDHANARVVPSAASLRSSSSPSSPSVETSFVQPSFASFTSASTSNQAMATNMRTTGTFPKFHVESLKSHNYATTDDQALECKDPDGPPAAPLQMQTPVPAQANPLSDTPAHHGDKFDELDPSSMLMPATSNLADDIDDHDELRGSDEPPHDEREHEM